MIINLNLHRMPMFLIFQILIMHRLRHLCWALWTILFGTLIAVPLIMSQRNPLSILQNSLIMTLKLSKWVMDQVCLLPILVPHIFLLLLLIKFLVLKNLLHVPLITKNFLSVSSFARDKIVLFTFTTNHCYVVDQTTKKILLQGTLKDGLYSFPMLHNHLPSSSVYHTSLTHNTLIANVCHQRLGHCNMDTLKKIFHLVFVLATFLVNICNCLFILCYCLHKPLELVFANVWGPSPIPASNGARYTFLLLILIVSIHEYIFFILSHRFLLVFKNLNLLLKIKCVLNCVLYKQRMPVNFCLKKVLDQHGIQHKLICSHTQEQNGVIECKHRHIVDMGLTLLATASLPRRLWAKVFLT